MIFTNKGDKFFYLDILLHLFFSFSLITVLFIIKFRKIKQEELDKKVRKVLNTNIMNELSDVTNVDVKNLEILKKIYTHEDKYDKVLNDDIKKSAYGQVIIFGFVVILTIFYLENKKGLLNLLLDKIFTFIILGSVLYIYSEYIRERYVEITEKTIYEEIRRMNRTLKISTTY